MMRSALLFIIFTSLIITAQNKELRKEDFTTKMRQYNYILGLTSGKTAAKLPITVSAEEYYEGFISGLKSNTEEPEKMFADAAPKKTTVESIAAGYGVIYKDGGIEPEKLFFIAGFNDGIKGENRFFTQTEWESINNELITFVSRNKMTSAYNNTSSIINAGADARQFFEENKSKRGVKVLPGGTQYKTLKLSEYSISPKSSDTVTVHFEGRFLDGRIFASTYKTNKPETFILDKVIYGLTEAIQKMCLGETFEIYIPASNAYEYKGYKNIIPPNSALIYKVELLKINSAGIKK